MTPKITCGDNFARLLAYCEDKPVVQKTGGAEVQPGSERLAVLNFVDGTGCQSSAKDLAKALHSWSARSKRIEEPVFHASLSFPGKDNPDDVTAVSIARDFLREMGYGEVPAVIYRHHDTEHPHLHIIVSRIGENGKKIDAYNEVRRAIGICRRLEHAYGLTVVNSVRKMADLSLKPKKPLDLKPGRPFGPTVLHNLGYYLNHEQVAEWDALQVCLRRHAIDLVRTGVQGIIFYRLDKGKHRSMLRGRDFGKGFKRDIGMRLQRNSRLQASMEHQPQRKTLRDWQEENRQPERGETEASNYESVFTGLLTGGGTATLYNAGMTDGSDEEWTSRKKKKRRK